MGNISSNLQMKQKRKHREYFFTHRILRLFFCTLLLLGTERIYSKEVPSHFEPVTSLDGVTDGAYYVVGTYDNGGNFRLLGSDNHKGKLLASSPVRFSQNNTLHCTDSTLIWKFSVAEKNRIVLSKTSGSGFVFINDIDKTDVGINNSKSTTFTIEEAGDGRFFLRSSAERSLGIYYNGGNVYYFGNYTPFGADSDTLYVYKGTEKLSSQKSQTGIPENGKGIGILLGENLAYTEPGSDIVKAIPGQGLLLRNDKVARSEKYSMWTYAANADSTFKLQASPSKDLNNPSESFNVQGNTLWEWKGGHIVSATNADLFLAYDSNEEIFVLSADEDSCGRTLIAPLLLPIADAPRVETDAAQSISFFGGWTAEELQAQCVKSYSVFDFTHCTLPVSIPATEFPAKSSNSLIFVNAESHKGEFPGNWENIIVCDNDECRLTKHLQLKDKEAFHIDRPAIPAEGISYVRSAHSDGKWETIFLPFTAKAPKDFAVAAIQDLDGNAISIDNKVETLRAYTPYLIRYTGNSSKDFVSLTLHSESDTLYPSPVLSESFFRGTLSGLVVGNTDAGIYLLNESGDCFVLSETGSALPPFRAFIHTEKSQAANLLISDATAIPDAASCEHPDCSPLYSIDGTRVLSIFTKEALCTLPAGIYICKGKKYLVP